MLERIKQLTYKQALFYTVLIFGIIASIIFVYNNHSFYERPIAKVLDMEVTEIDEVEDRHQNKDTVFEQSLTAEIKNGHNKGQIIVLMNQYSASGAYDHEYNIDDEVFVNFSESSEETKELTGSITDTKRDKYIVIVAWIFVLVLLVVGRIQGLFASISLAINLLLLSYALDLYVNTGLNLLWICAVTVVLFTITSLLLVNGFNEKTYAAIFATILGTFSALLITYLAMVITGEKGLHYEEMGFLTRPYKLVFMAGLFIGSLGAVMDVAITMSASVFELFEKDHTISNETLKKSGLDIGKDIMGTMTNILFFAYVSGSIPMLILFLKNYSSLGFTLSMNLSLELARALAGGIGIVLTIPIGLYISIYFVNRKRVRQ